MAPFHSDKIDQIRKIYAENRAAKSLFDWFSTRQNSSRETSAERAASVIGEDYGSVINLFRLLDGIGVGQFFVGRKGNKSRMLWHYDLKSLGNCASGYDNELIADGPDQTETEFDKPDLGDGEYKNALTELSHEFQVRPNFKLRFLLPVDLSAQEAERIASWVKTIPFGM